MHHHQALALFRAAGDRRGQAKTLNNAGWVHILLGDHHQGLAHCEQALVLHRQVGDHRGEASTLESLGYAISETIRNQLAAISDRSPGTKDSAAAIT